MAAIIHLHLHGLSIYQVSIFQYDMSLIVFAGTLSEGRFIATRPDASRLSIESRWFASNLVSRRL
jgi:hypothetical protein